MQNKIKKKAAVKSSREMAGIKTNAPPGGTGYSRAEAGIKTHNISSVHSMYGVMVSRIYLNNVVIKFKM